ncbi:Uncharacterised protein [Neisseria meningitidis]|nr:Uncharacterised protein [Neisseria meningitidis]CWT24188.1 Uncharacterised protein [Neisseria meningitidis]
MSGGGFGGGRAVFVPNLAERTHCGQAGEAFDETLHPAAFVIDGDNEFGCAQGFDFGGECFELFDVLEVAAEEDDAADCGVEQALPFFSGQAEGGNVCHDGAARNMGDGHCGLLQKASDGICRLNRERGQALARFLSFNRKISTANTMPVVPKPNSADFVRPNAR